MTFQRTTLNVDSLIKKIRKENQEKEEFKKKHNITTTNRFTNMLILLKKQDENYILNPSKLAQDFDVDYTSATQFIYALKSNGYLKKVCLGHYKLIKTPPKYITRYRAE